MKAACAVGVIASLIMGISAQTKAGDAELQPRVTSEAQKLLTGDSPPVGIGVVRAAVKGENLEIQLSVQEGCFIESSHLCNVPTKTFTASDGATQVPYSIPLFDVYEFVCMYESDFFVIAGHAQVVCKQEQEQTAEQKAQYRQQPVRKLQESGLYEAYYEIPIECASADETTSGPIVTKGEPLVTKGQPLTRATLATLATLATKGELATRGELATKQTFATLATKQSLETYAPKSELIQSEQKLIESEQELIQSEQKLIESEQKLVESEQKVILPQENQIESLKVVTKPST